MNFTSVQVTHIVNGFLLTYISPAEAQSVFYPSWQEIVAALSKVSITKEVSYLQPTEDGSPAIQSGFIDVSKKNMTTP